MRYECGHVSGLFDAARLIAGSDGLRRASLKHFYDVQAPVRQSGYLARRFDRMPSLAIAHVPRGDEERSGGLQHTAGRPLRSSSWPTECGPSCWPERQWPARMAGAPAICCVVIVHPSHGYRPLTDCLIQPCGGGLAPGRRGATDSHRTPPGPPLSSARSSSSAWSVFLGPTYYESLIRSLANPVPMQPPPIRPRRLVKSGGAARRSR